MFCFGFFVFFFGFFFIPPSNFVWSGGGEEGGGNVCSVQCCACQLSWFDYASRSYSRGNGGQKSMDVSLSPLGTAGKQISTASSIPDAVPFFFFFFHFYQICYNLWIYAVWCDLFHCFKATQRSFTEVRAEIWPESLQTSGRWESLGPCLHKNWFHKYQ